MAAIVALPFLLSILLTLWGVFLGDEIEMDVMLLMSVFIGPTLAYIAVSGRAPLR